MKKNQPGCPCMCGYPPCESTVCGTVKGCNGRGLFPGATLTLHCTSDDTVADQAGTTEFADTLCFNLATAGSYTLTAHYATYTDQVWSFTVTDADLRACRAFTHTFNLVPDAGHRCSPCCGKTYPDTIDCTLLGKSFGATWDEANQVWVGCVTLRSGADKLVTTPIDPTTCAPPEDFVTYGQGDAEFQVRIALVRPSDGSPCYWQALVFGRCAPGYGIYPQSCDLDASPGHCWVSLCLGTVAEDCEGETLAETIPLDSSGAGGSTGCGTLASFLTDAGHLPDFTPIPLTISGS